MRISEAKTVIAGRTTTSNMTKSARSCQWASRISRVGVRDTRSISRPIIHGMAISTAEMSPVSAIIRTIAQPVSRKNTRITRHTVVGGASGWGPSNGRSGSIRFSNQRKTASRGLAALI